MQSVLETMKHKHRLLLLGVLVATTVVCMKARAQKTVTQIPEVVVQKKKKTILYTRLNIFPEVEEIREVTENHFFNTIYERISKSNDLRILQTNGYVNMEENLQEQVAELCQNNDADFVVIPSIKFFKVGFGKYIFSSQVVVTLDLYNAQGHLVSSSVYDTLKRKGRMFGSAESSIKKGTMGAYKMMKKNIP